MSFKTQRSNANSGVNRDFKGIWIPKELWLSRELTPIQKCLLAEIDSLDCGEGCYAKNKYLAKMFNTTPPRMANLISELRKKGFIEDISFDGRERRMRARTGFPKAVKTPKRVHGIGEGSIHKTSESSIHRINESSVHGIGDPPMLGREKTRGKMRETPPPTFSIPTVLNTPEFIQAWNAFVADRKERNKQLTTGAAAAILKRLSQHPTKAAQVCYKMVESGWSTFEWDWEGVTSAVGPVLKKKASFKDYIPLQQRRQDLPPELRTPTGRIPPARPNGSGSTPSSGNGFSLRKENSSIVKR